MQDEQACVVTSQVIDEEVDSLSRHELEGCWRSLCAMMLLRTANLMTCQMLSRKDFATQRRAALQWIYGKTTGIITFSAACEALDIDSQVVRDGLIRYAENRGRWPINKEGLRRHVFGKLHESPAKNQVASRMVAGSELCDRDYLVPTRQGSGVPDVGVA